MDSRIQEGAPVEHLGHDLLFGVLRDSRYGTLCFDLFHAPKLHHQPQRQCLQLFKPGQRLGWLRGICIELWGAVIVGRQVFERILAYRRAVVGR